MLSEKKPGHILIQHNKLQIKHRNKANIHRHESGHTVPQSVTCRRRCAKYGWEFRKTLQLFIGLESVELQIMAIAYWMLWCNKCSYGLLNDEKKACVSRRGFSPLLVVEGETKGVQLVGV